jgi:glycosyltransferase involved in cell wall biosynthesis
MEKPILLGVDGESRQIVESYPAGLYFEPENESDFIEKLYLLKNDKALYESLKHGCQKLVKDFDRVSLAKDMAEILYMIGDNHKG